MEGSRKRKIETRGAEAAEEEQRKKLQAKLGKVHCNYCKRDVSDQMYIKSAVRFCSCPPVIVAVYPRASSGLLAGCALPERGRTCVCRFRTTWTCAWSASQWGWRSTT